ncbi:MAG: hypothetical protein JWM28_4409 [Chitinophagaceae bacterium]|nr:hypothetical protein [Chitinophagaceae bacterium]
MREDGKHYLLFNLCDHPAALPAKNSPVKLTLVHFSTLIFILLKLTWSP